MADKATLLDEIPPVAKGSSSGEAPQGVSVTAADQEISITAFQAMTYGSFVLTFVLAGFAGVVLYRKAIGDIEQRIVRSAKTLALVMALMALHGFAATYLYTNYLRNVSDSAPLSMTVLIWVILGATTSFVGYRLIEIKDKLKTSDAVIDSIFYAAVFISVTLALSPSVGANAALILSLLAIILCIVPFSSFFTACKRIKFNRKGSKRKPGRSVLYTLISLPPLVPLFSIFHVVGLLGPDLTLFLLNAVSFTFVSYISFAMLTRIKHPIENQSNQAIQPSAAAAAETPGEPATKTAMDPLVAELLAEQDAMPQEEPVPLETPGVIPPEKPDRPRAKPEAPEEKRQAADKNRQQSEAPQEPGKPKKSVEEANQGSVLKVKPPTKPKKRL